MVIHILTIVNRFSILKPDVSITGVAKRTGSDTLAVHVYEQLRTAILNAEYQPGERLKQVDLASTFGVSLGVMREALSLLAAHNLVEIDRNRGCQVTPLSRDALRNLTSVRKLNEGVALRLSVEHGGVTWECEVLAAHHRMASLPMLLPGDPAKRNEEWAVAHMSFHRKLIEACDNPLLLAICARLSDEAELYRAWSMTRTSEAHRDVAGEHKALLEAALAHDADRAVMLFDDHVDRTQAIVMDDATLMPAATGPGPSYGS